MASPREKLTRERVAGIKVPVLVAVGTKDDVAGSGEALAALIPGAKALPIFPTATTCWRSATGSIRRGCSTFLTGVPNS